MSSLGSRVTMPRMLCPVCSLSMRVVTSLPGENGTRNVTYICQQCRRLKTIRDEAHSESAA